MFRAIGAPLWLVLLAALASAQSITTTGAIQGTVRDRSGSLVPGAGVTVLGTHATLVRRTMTGAEGAYWIGGLPVGHYSLRVEHEGFHPAVVDPVVVSLGQTVLQTVTLSLEVATERVDVQEQADAVQSSATTAAVSLGGDRIEEAPSPNRNFLSFLLAAPGVAASAGSNTGRSPAGLRNPSNDSGFVFAGMRGRNNSIAIDGMDNRDETTGGNRVAVGLEMVAEFRSSGTAVGADFGSAAGGMVNMVTRSGVNLWHGDGTFFFQNELLNARNAEVEKPGRPRFRRYQPGVSVGGPLVRDRTYFFTALEQMNESGEEWSEGAPGTIAVIQDALRTTRFARAGVHILRPGLFATGETDTEFSFKVNHALTARQSLTTRYAYSRGRVRNDVQSVDNFTDVSARGSSLLSDHSLVGSWSVTPSAALLQEVRVQWAQREAGLTPNAPGPMLEIPGLLTFGQGFRLLQQRQERHAEAIEALQIVRSGHLWSCGASVHTVSLDSSLADRFGGIYVFPNLEALAAGEPDLAIQAFGDPHTRMRTWPVGAWVQDRWQARSGLTVEAGLRYDWQRLPAGFPSPSRNIAPRLGLAWRPGANGPWVLRLGAGLFYDRYPLANLNQAVQKDGLHAYEQYLPGELARLAFAAASGGPFLPDLSLAGRAVYRPAPGFAATYSEKVTVGVERRLDADTTAVMELSWVRGLHLPRIRNAGALPPIYHLEQTARSTYRGVSVSVNRRLRREITFLGSYTGGLAQDDASDYDEHPSDVRDLRRDWGRSRQHQAHRVAFSGLFELPEDGWTWLPDWVRNGLDNLTFAPVFTYGSPRPVNLVETTDPARTGAYPLVYRLPGVPRNSLDGPETVALNLRVMKTIPVMKERARWQFGAEAFNLLNHTNPLRVSPYRTPSLGQPVEIQPARQVQLMMQFEY